MLTAIWGVLIAGALGDWFDPDLEFEGQPEGWTFEAATGFFVHDNISINANIPDYTTNALGLLNRSYESDANFDPEKNKTQWERFAHYLDSQNSLINETEQSVWKVLFLHRNGEAWSSVAKNRYADECWDCHWSQQVGNGTITWEDAELTPEGKHQAEVSKGFWETAARVAKIPFPEVLLTSPLSRALQTATITFDALLKEASPREARFHDADPRLLVWPEVRDALNQCTCTKRRQLSWISDKFPSVAFSELNVPEETDTEWRPGMSESLDDQKFRAKMTLDYFDYTASTFFYVSTHPSIIKAFLDVMGHPNSDIPIPPGYILPVLYSVDKDEAKAKLYRKRTPAKAVSKCDICSTARRA